MQSNEEEVIIVNKDDQIIGYKRRGSLNKDDIYRVSALWITNSEREILLAKRHHTKLRHPNLWGPAVAGTNEKGETYKSNIIKEAEEEIGIKNFEPILGPKIEISDEYHYFTQWFTLCINKNDFNFRIQETEVEEIGWFKSEELADRLHIHPEEFLPRMKKYYQLFSKI